MSSGIKIFIKHLYIYISNTLFQIRYINHFLKTLVFDKKMSFLVNEDKVHYFPLAVNVV